MLQAQIPANTSGFFGELTAIAAFDVYDFTDFFHEYLELDLVEAPSPKFEAVGMESVYFYNNLGTFTFVIAGQLMLVALWAILAVFGLCIKKARKWQDALAKRIFFNSWIVIVQESFLIVMVAALVQLDHKELDDSHLSPSRLLNDTEEGTSEESIEAAEVEDNGRSPWGLKLQYWSCVAISIFYLLLPVYVTVKMFFNHAEM